MLSLKFGPVLRQYMTVIIADFTFLHMGLWVAWLSPLLIQLKDTNQTVLPKPITDDQGAWLLSLSSLFGLVAFLFNGYLADRIGRKYTIILGSVPRLINGLIFIFSNNLWLLILGRGISGVSDVFCCSVVPTYASEIASKEIRGGLGTIAQILSAIGSMVILSIGPFLDYMTLTIVITIAVTGTFIPLFFLPESPYFLYAQGRVEESKAVLRKLRNSNEIEDELIEYSLNTNINAQINRLDLLKDVVVLKTVGKVMVLAVGSQMTGFNAVMFYLQTVFESTHTTVRPEVSSVIIGCIQVIACLCTISLTDRFGRKPLLMSSLIGLTIGMVGLGTFFKLRDENYEIAGFLNYLPLVSLIVVIFCFNAGMGATIWTLTAELFDGPSRAMGVSIAVFTATVFTFLTTKYFDSETQTIGPAATYWMFGGCCIFICLFVLFCVPETRGKAFSEIQKDMRRQKEILNGTHIGKEYDTVTEDNKFKF